MTASRKAVGTWLVVCAALVVAMVVLGGYTRLTGSGLSIVEWKPVSGVFPPLGEQAWAAEFAAYQASPEFRVKNATFTLHDFKGIFWLEYLHRLLARLLGFVFLGPFLWFAAKRQLTPRLVRRLAIIFLLGGLQGAMGWLMVKSGLIDVPAVSPHRLAAHLGLALLILVALQWTALEVLQGRWRPVRGPGLTVASMVGLTALSGAYVAATHAGLVFPTFPLMEGRVLPPGVLALDPVWRNFVENKGTIQFVHRAVALTTATVALVCALRWRRRAGKAAWALGTMALVQPTLGVLTLLWHVPLNLAAAHQSGAVLLLMSAVWVMHRLRVVAPER